METRLIIGLGNPGKRYEDTRHNVGFRVVERLAAKHETDFRAHARVPALIADWKYKSTHWIALKPITFMNLSGQAVATALNFWKLEPSSLLIIVDDVEITPGRLRLRLDGNTGGHNGLKSVMEHLGTKEFARLRVGIGRPLANPKIDMAEWVLKGFEKTELIWLEESLNKAVCAVEAWALEGPVAAMNRYNTVDRLPSESSQTKASP